MQGSSRRVQIVRVDGVGRYGEDTSIRWHCPVSTTKPTCVPICVTIVPHSPSARCAAPSCGWRRCTAACTTPSGHVARRRTALRTCGRAWRACGTLPQVGRACTHVERGHVVLGERAYDC